MKIKNTETRPGKKEERKTMTRGKAIKRVGAVTLAAGTMLVMLNRPAQAQLEGSFLKPPGDGFGG